MLKSIEHPEFTQAIIHYNEKTGTSVELHKQLWKLWRYNQTVFVPTYDDLAVIDTTAGSAYIFYTESKFICTSVYRHIVRMPFKNLLNRIYTTTSIHGIFINPTKNNIYAPYTIGFSEEILRELCKGDFLVY